MRTELITLSFSLADISDAAACFWQVCKPYPILAFSGEMGAGKTTFIHNLCDHLRVEDAVSSPTFSLINEYHFSAAGRDTTIFHQDWYRLRDTAEAINAGMEDGLITAGRDRAYCFIEWPEKAPELLPLPHLWISIETVSAHERMMTVTLVN